ncbi:MAG TPA: glutathione S-transferase family protein [Solirubrobacteraceae bacterium]|nr:glutathione S-transferase family protein [Solirubrobacteraceae bacterium]
MAAPRLWSWHLSPFAGKVRIAAAITGTELDLIEIDPNKRPPRLRELNPAGRVPVLELDEVVVRESSAICDWLQDVRSGPSLWPEDRDRRATARGLMRWLDDELTASFFLSFRKEARGPVDGDPPDVVERLRTRLMRRWPKLEDELARGGTPWLAGLAEPSLADLSGLPLAVRIPQWGPELAPPPELSRVNAWLDALRAHPAAGEVKRRGRPAAEL